MTDADYTKRSQIGRNQEILSELVKNRGVE
jgi:hypothetical protein